MYWIYLAIFILVILTPKVVENGTFFLSEEDVESLLIFGLGVFGFILYLAKEKALLRVFREKLHLQKQTSIITRDLSDSYSYIGEMNRKFDIVKEFIFNMPKHTREAILKGDSTFYTPILEAARLLAKTDQVSLRFVNLPAKKIVQIHENEIDAETFASFDAVCLLSQTKNYWEENNCVIIRAPRSAPDTSAFIIFPKLMNRMEDTEIFKILASEALFLYCIEQGISSHQS